jgi:hypothetical protein
MKGVIKGLFAGNSVRVLLIFFSFQFALLTAALAIAGGKNL